MLLSLTTTQLVSRFFKTEMFKYYYKTCAK